MQLVDARDTRINISSEWNPTVEEIVQLFDNNCCTKFINEMLETEPVRNYFEYHLVSNFNEFKSLPVQRNWTTIINWILDKDALWNDVKVNTEIRLLHLQGNSNLQEACKHLDKDVIMDVIYALDEAIVTFFQEAVSQGPLFYLSNWIKKDEARKKIILTEEL